MDVAASFGGFRQGDAAEEGPRDAEEGIFEGGERRGGTATASR